MPKDRRVNSSSSNRAMASPYSRESLKAASDNPFPHVGDEKEWDETRCPICMEHPHNAVLLLCSSHDNGCRPFICDTSYRHSNCLDQFRKSFSKTPSDLLCPLCRGAVTGWNAIQSARKYMDLKKRSCSLETCSFSGNYAEVRRHARIKHPCKRPSEANPTRQSNWSAMERQREIEDALAYDSDLDYDWEPEDDFFSGEGFFDFESGMSDIEDSLMDQMFFRLSWPVLSTYEDLSSEEEMVDSGNSRSNNRMPLRMNYGSTFNNPDRNIRSRSIHRRQNNRRRRENENASTSLRPRSSSYNSRNARIEPNTRSRSSYYRREHIEPNTRSRSSHYRNEVGSSRRVEESSRRRRTRYHRSAVRDVPESLRRE